MASGKEVKVKLPKLDSIYRSNEERRELEKLGERKIIPISLIDSFPNHPFKVRYDEQMQNLIDSVEMDGVLVPCLVRPKENGRYEMIAGHRRMFAAKKAGIFEIRCDVEHYSDDQAIVVMVNSNIQREGILPSERAYAFKMRMEAMERQGYRSDLKEGATELHRLKSRDIIGKESNDISGEMVRQYIRLTYLIFPLLNLIDEKKMAIKIGVQLSYLKEDMQELLWNCIEMEQQTPNVQQAKLLRKMQEDGVLNEDSICHTLSQPKPNQMTKFVMRKEKIKQFFPTNASDKVIEETILKALALYYRERERERKKEKTR